MAIIDNQILYNKAKLIADKVYAKPSAYKSGFIVSTYKKLGGTYTDDNRPKNLARWFKEEWKSIGGKYPTLRPTKRISLKTPLLASEIKKSNLKNQINLKQKIKGRENLPPFQKL